MLCTYTPVIEHTPFIPAISSCISWHKLLGLGLDREESMPALGHIGRKIKSVKSFYNYIT